MNACRWPWLQSSVVALLRRAPARGTTAATRRAGTSSRETTNDKDATVAKMLKERNGRNASTSDVEAKRATLIGSCKPADKQAVKIGDLG